MKLYSLVLLLGFYCFQTSGYNNTTGFCNGNLYIPIITIVFEALLVSIAVNVYFICMRKYRESCQKCYNNHFEVCCCCDSTNERDQSDDQAPEDTQSAVSVESEDQADERAVDCVYSSVKLIKKATADTHRSATSDSGEIRHCEDHHSDAQHSAVCVSCEDQTVENAVDSEYSAIKLNETAPADTHHSATSDSSGIQHCEDHHFDTQHSAVCVSSEIWECEDQAVESAGCLYSNLKC